MIKVQLPSLYDEVVVLAQFFGFDSVGVAVLGATVKINHFKELLQGISKKKYTLLIKLK